jgi:hypothetical protein
MLLDYIKVFEWNGQGEVNFGPPQPIDESLGLYTDETTVSDSLELGISSHIYVWESTLSDGTIPPFEGGNGISWQTTGKGWFGAGIMSVQPLNMSNFGEGYLNFRIKIPADVSFQIGIIDTWGNQNYLEFPANTTKYGLTRNGEWGQASVPISELRGELIDLRMLSYSFVVLEVNGTACEFGLDDIYWDGGSTTVSIENSQVQPSSFQLYQNYPNPFNPSTNIDFNLEHSADVKLKVFNISGQEVMTLVNEFMDFGHHTYSLDANKLPTGIYFYTLIVGEQRVIRKMTVIK